MIGLRRSSIGHRPHPASLLFLQPLYCMNGCVSRFLLYEPGNQTYCRIQSGHFCHVPVTCILAKNGIHLKQEFLQIRSGQRPVFASGPHLWPIPGFYCPPRNLTLRHYKTGLPVRPSSPSFMSSNLVFGHRSISGAHI